MACIIDAFVGAGVYLVLGRINGSIAMLVYLAYWLTRDALPFLEGQSIGKKLMKIRAVTSTGGSLSGNWQASIVRNIPMIIPIFPLVELYMLYTRQTQPGPLLRFGDEWAKTKVIVVDTPTGI